MMETDLHNSPRRFEKEKANISVFKNGKVAIAFLEAMVTNGILNQKTTQSTYLVVCLYGIIHTVKVQSCKNFVVQIQSQC
jgi:hypothetical protein